MDKKKIWNNGYSQAIDNFKVQLEPIMILLKRLIKGDYFKEDDKELKWINAYEQLAKQLKEKPK